MEGTAKKCRAVSHSLLLAAVLLAVAGGVHTGYALAAMRCDILHAGASAPLPVALIVAVPYALGILILVPLAFFFARRVRQ